MIERLSPSGTVIPVTSPLKAWQQFVPYKASNEVAAGNRGLFSPVTALAGRGAFNSSGSIWASGADQTNPAFYAALLPMEPSNNLLFKFAGALLDEGAIANSEDFTGVNDKVGTVRLWAVEEFYPNYRKDKSSAGGWNSAALMGTYLGEVSITIGVQPVATDIGVRNGLVWAKEITVVEDATLSPGMRVIGAVAGEVDCVPTLVLDRLGALGVIMQATDATPGTDANNGLGIQGFVKGV